MVVAVHIQFTQFLVSSALYHMYHRCHLKKISSSWYCTGIPLFLGWDRQYKLVETLNVVAEYLLQEWVQLLNTQYILPWEKVMQLRLRKHHKSNEKVLGVDHPQALVSVNGLDRLPDSVIHQKAYISNTGPTQEVWYVPDQSIRNTWLLNAKLST